MSIFCPLTSWNICAGDIVTVTNPDVGQGWVQAICKNGSEGVVPEVQLILILRTLKCIKMVVTFRNPGVHWEDRRSKRSCPNPGWCDFTGVPPTSYQWFPPNCLSGKYVHQLSSNQSSSGWDDDDRWSSEDEHNYEVEQCRQLWSTQIIDNS